MGSESDCGRAVIAGLKVVYDAENGIYELRGKKTLCKYSNLPLLQRSFKRLATPLHSHEHPLHTHSENTPHMGIFQI